MTFTLIILVVLNLYMAVNFGRLIKKRMHPKYLWPAFWRTVLWLIGLQALVVATAKLINYSHINLLTVFYLLAGTQLAGAVILLASTLRNLKTTLPPRLESSIADRELPTLTVCVPARNETEDLEACLQTLIASDYPKLEILVLDDCSQNKRTPEIIRSFAHDGVRFIAGKEPDSHWLAKNYAYQQLAEEANGGILLFCGVDVRFKPNSLTDLVKMLLIKQKAMISVMPQNVLNEGWGLKTLLVQPSRYAWELALPRRLLNRPPVLSTCWLITSKSLAKTGGFAAVSRRCVPESFFARTLARQSDGYSFLQSDENIGLTSTKNFDEQLATAVRSRYPQLRRRPENTVIVSVFEIGLLVWPFTLLLAAVVSGIWWLTGITVLTCLILAVLYSLIVRLTYRHFMINGLWMLPFAALYDVGLLNYSMLKYEFSDVIWKGRNVCIPIMRAIPGLPKF